MGLPSNKELKKLVKELLREGWSMESGTKHLKFRSPGGHLLSLSSSPSCPFAATNARKDAERIKKMESQ